MQQTLLEVLIEFDAGSGVQALPAPVLPCTIGSGPRDAVRIRHPSIAPGHAHLWSPEPSILAIAPAAGPVMHPNGPLQGPCEAKDGAWFYVGQVPIRVRVSAKVRPTAPERKPTVHGDTTRPSGPVARTPPAVIVFGLLLILAVAAAASIPVYFLYKKHLQAPAAAVQPRTPINDAPIGEDPGGTSLRTASIPTDERALASADPAPSSSPGARTELGATARSSEANDGEFETATARDTSNALKRTVEACSRGDVDGWFAAFEEYASVLGEYKKRKFAGHSSATEDYEVAKVVSQDWIQALKCIDESPMKDAIQKRGKPERFMLRMADIIKRYGLTK